MTFREWFAIWLKDYCNGLKPLTVKQYQNMGDVHILPSIGAVKLSQLKSPQIQGFINDLSRTGKTVRVKDEKGRITERKEALSAKTVRNIFAIMKKCLSVAIDQGILKYNPCDRVSLPRVVRKEIQPLTEEQVKKFLTVIKGNQYERLFAVILFTGLREAEALGLTWDSFDEKKNMLHVYRQLQKRVGEDMCFETLKNGKSRDIPLSPYVIKLLQEQRASQIEKRFAAGDSWQGWKDSEEMKTALIFTTDEGTHLGVATVCRHYKQLVAQAGAPEARVHDLRHTFACLSLQNGDSPKTVQSNLGHATAGFTLDVYGHVSERMKEESAARMQAFIETVI